MSIEAIKLMEDLKQGFIAKFEEFIQIGQDISRVQSEQIEFNRDRTLNEMFTYFQSHDFSAVIEGSNLTATYQNTVITLKRDDDYASDTIYYQFKMMPHEVYAGILVKPCRDDEEKTYWRHILKIDDTFVNYENYREINQCTDLDTIKDLVQKLQENIDKYRDTINCVDTFKYIYSFYKNERVEYNTFKEVFEEYITK